MGLLNNLKREYYEEFKGHSFSEKALFLVSKIIGGIFTLGGLILISVAICNIVTNMVKNARNNTNNDSSGHCAEYEYDIPGGYHCVDWEDSDFYF